MWAWASLWPRSAPGRSPPRRRCLSVRCPGRHSARGSRPRGQRRNRPLIGTSLMVPSRRTESASPLSGAVWSNLASAYALRTSDARRSAGRVTESDGVLSTEVLICPPDEGQDSETQSNDEKPPADGQAEEDDRSGRGQRQRPPAVGAEEPVLPFGSRYRG